MSTSTTDLANRLEKLEREVSAIGSALTWVMVQMKQETPSPIVGGDPTITTLLDLYKQDLEAALVAAQGPVTNG